MNLNLSKYHNHITIAFSLLFIFINSIVIYYLGFIFLGFLPIALLVVLISLKSTKLAFFLIVFLTSISLNLSNFVPNTPVDLSLFTEPLLVLLLFIFMIKSFFYKKIHTNVAFHPIAKSVYFLLFWMLIATMSSTMPLVSAKYWLSQLWFIVPIYFFGIKLFRDVKNIKTFLWVMAISTFFVVIYSTIKLGQASLLAKNAAHFVVRPFYKDHTIYGAILALIVPVWWGIFFRTKQNPLVKYISLVFAITFTVGVLLSYSRASWIGLFSAVIIWIVVKLRIKFKYLLGVGLVFVAMLFSFWTQILDTLEKNRQDSSSNLAHHISSITNISTDASNVERLNRWYCAIEMFKEKPVTGWGPGTYMFQYAPFQLERMRTIISTNFGDIGNAHSEYLGPLAEQGLPGTLAIIFLVITIITTGLRIHKNSDDKEIKMLALGITLGFITYFLHGLMNNFLDSDKIAVPFWGLAAILTALDIYHVKKVNK